MATTDLIDALFDFAVAHPDGFKNSDFMTDADVTLDDFNKATNGLRAVLSDDTITLVCEPAGASEKWTYRLVGQVEEGSAWVQNRLKDAESRFKTLASVSQALVNATDGRTADGRRARIINKAVSRLLEDLAELEDAS